MATPNYSVNYEDERFQKVEADKQAALQDVENTYSGIINESDKYYQAQIDNTKNWENTQSQLQQERTDFTIEQIEQQKDQAHKDYLKEQSGSYVDWKKQSNGYGSEAEQMAAAGLQNTGFSESSQVAMYNTYQNRIATARETYNRAVINYNNQMTEARLQNNSALAEIAYQSFEKQLQLSLDGFQYKNNLILEQANKKLEVDNTYYQRYQDVLNQINTENAMAEEVRQFDQQYNESVRQFNLEYQQKQKEFNEGIRQFNEEIARLKKKDDEESKIQREKLELEKKELQQQQKQFEAEQKLKKEQLAEEKRQFNAQMAAKSSSGSSGSSRSGSAAISGSGASKSTVASSTGSTGNKVTSSNIANTKDLGIGPLRDDYVAKLVAEGKVTATEKNGKIYVANKPQTIQEQTYQKYFGRQLPTK